MMKKIVAVALFLLLTGLAVLTFSQPPYKFKALKIHVKEKIIENKKVVTVEKTPKKLLNSGKRQVHVSKNLKIKVLGPARKNQQN